MKSKTILKNIYYSVLVFMYIFMFKIVWLVDSAIAVGIFLFILILGNKRAQRMICNIVKSKAFVNIILVFIVMIAWLLFSTVINGAMDFSFFKTWVHAFIQIIIGIMLYAYFYSKRVQKSITNYLVLAFIIQTIIEWLALISPTVKALVYSTKDVHTILIANQYGGIRGLSLAGSSFFGLAIGFGLIYILYYSKFNTLFKKHPVIKFFIFCFLITGTFFAGRTGLVGLVIIALYGFYKVVFSNSKVNIKVVLLSLGFIGIVFLAFYVIANHFRETNEIFEKLGYLYDYVFEALISAFKGNGLTTTSTSELFGEMYFRIPFKTWIFGDGLYTDPLTGGYYMNTDAGYMRIILYGGIIALLLMIAFQKAIFDLGGKQKSKTFIVIWFFLFVTQSKGEVIGISLIVLSMCTLYSLHLKNHYEKVRGEKHVKYCSARI